MNGADGRRFFCLDISSEKIGDRAYWNHLYGECDNDSFGEAFFCYLMEIDTTGFNSQDFPETDKKKDAIVQHLDIVYKYLKSQYILTNQDFSGSVGDIYEEFKCDNINSKISKQEFVNKLKEIGINHYKSNDKRKYKVSHEQLLGIANKLHWIHELDEYTPPESPKEDKDLKEQMNVLKDSNAFLKSKLENKEKKVKNMFIEKKIETLSNVIDNAIDTVELRKDLDHKLKIVESLSLDPSDPDQEALSMFSNKQASILGLMDAEDD